MVLAGTLLLSLNATGYTLLTLPRGKRNDDEIESSGDYELASPFAAPDCPPWFLPATSSSGDSHPCYCADTLKNIVQCDDRNQTSYLALTYCMSYHEPTSMVLVGACPYAVIPSNIREIWIPLPSNVSQISALASEPGRSVLWSMQGGVCHIRPLW